MIRVLAVDDHPLLREGIAALIGSEEDMQLVGEASNGREAVELFRKYQPDITLMDLQMPEMNGLDAIISIRGESPEAKSFADDLQGRRTNPSRTQIGCARLPAKKYASQGTH